MLGSLQLRAGPFYAHKLERWGFPIVVQWKQIQLGTMRLQVRSLASLSGLRIQRCRELWLGRRRSLDLALLWLWYRLVATAPIRPLARDPPYATDVALQRQKDKKKKKIGEMDSIHLYCCLFCFCFIFLGSRLWHMEVPRPGVGSEL